MTTPTPDTILMDDKTELSPSEAKRRRMRSIAIGLALAFMAILFYAATIIRLGGQVANRAM